MIAAAQDQMACDLIATRNRKLRLSVEAEELQPGSHRAIVWASHSGDEVLRREVPLSLGQTVIDLASDVDHIGFANFRVADGQCVDLMEGFLTLEVQVLLEIESGSTLHLRHSPSRTTHKVHPASSASMVKVRADEGSRALDKRIRRNWLDRRIHEREAAERREGNFSRFGPDAFEEAVQYFLSLLRQNPDSTEPIYLADPYFMGRLKGYKGTQLYLDMFAATSHRCLRILCTQKDSGSTQPWWSSYPGQVTSHVRVRAFRKHDDKPGFHDRYLILPDREILITHSLNGWPQDGVTFARLPYDIYRAEAESLWEMDIGSNAADLFVQEIA